MSKAGAQSRWNGRLHRYGEERKVEDTRQQRDKRGKWRRVTDEVTEGDYCERRREKPGFRRGARVRSALAIEPMNLEP